MTRTQALRMAKANRSMHVLLLNKLHTAETERLWNEKYEPQLRASLDAIGLSIKRDPPPVFTDDEQDIIVFGSVEAAREWWAQWP